jgi:sulfur carrier protein ThiS
MAKVNAKVVGGDITELEVGTIADLKHRLGVPNHTAMVNGQPAQNDQALRDEDFVSLAPAVKGA